MKVRHVVVLLAIPLSAGMLLPHPRHMPVEGADRSSFHPRSFWYHPWGRSGTHKGVDIFAHKGTTVTSSTAGLVIYAGTMGRGGRVALLLGPKWRLHYYAHLDDIHVKLFKLVPSGGRIGTVGDSGNAAGKPPHLHYSVMTLVPYPWRIDRSPQGWKKMFYLDPGNHLPT